MKLLRLFFPLALLLASSPARADDGGAWIQFEYHQPIVRRPPETPRFFLRFWSDTRFYGAAGGLAQQFLRIGPILMPTQWFFLAVHGTIYADKRPNGSFEQEARLEAEPNFTFRIGPMLFFDRNRVEYRWRASGVRVRYRNQLRIMYAPPGLKFIPFATNEWLVDFREGFNENRLNFGLGFLLAPHIRLEIGYLLRSRLITGAWQHDHIACTYLQIALQKRK